MEPYTKIDISILKYKTYISKYPDKAYGYYCLGNLYFLSDNYKRAEDYYKRALLRNNRYIHAVIGLIQLYVFRKKFFRAVNLYDRYNEAIQSKKIYVRKLAGTLSAVYRTSIVETSTPLIVFNPLRRLLTGKKENLVTDLLLCIYYLSKRQRDPQAMVIFKKCIFMDNIDDNLRWDLLNILVRQDRSLSGNTEIASLFQTLPDNCTSEYANIILDSAFTNGSNMKIKNIYKVLNNYDRVISSSNLWKYIYWNRDRRNYDITVYNCCRRLLKIGWMDRLLAETLLNLKQLNIANPTAKESKLLNLYGYELECR